MSILVRPYQSEDYKALVELYQQEDLYGGQYDDDRDSAARLDALMAYSQNAILVAEHNKKICGTVSLIKDARTAFLFRFAVLKTDNEKEIVHALFEESAAILRSEGHKQVLVYSPAGHETLGQRYLDLGFNKGGDYACYWRNIGFFE